MPRQRAPLFSLRATGLLGGHRRGALDPAAITRTVFSVADSSMSGVPPDSQDFNFGAIAAVNEYVIYIFDDKSVLYRSIIRFDLRSFIGQSFSAASLTIFVTTLYDLVFTAILSRCTRPNDWIESEVTWNNFKTGSPWTAAGGDFDDIGPPPALTRPNPGAAGSFTLDGALPLVQDALDNRDGWLSLIGRLTDEDPGVLGGIVYGSKESPAPERPFLTLTP